MKIQTNDVSMVLSGEAGQGIQTLEKLLMKIFKRAGAHVFAFSEFMSRIRGGNNSTEIRISNKRVNAYIDRIDLFFPLNNDSMSRFKNRISEDTIIIGDDEFIDDEFLTDAYTVNVISLKKIMEENDLKGFLNTILLGFITGLFQIDEDLVREEMQAVFHKANEKIQSKNEAAIKAGIKEAEKNFNKDAIDLSKISFEKTNKDYMMDGSEAVTLGAIAGGCNFISSYPMSPGTGVLVNMAKYSKEFDIIVEQAEDEISAINMAIGAWYAGARAIVTTSGGGFALMVEGLSLAGATETPVVVHVGQRPGPATGLPTRTEQGDLLFSLFSGHGDFPRVILAPGNLSQCATLSQHAFHLADKYQVPVILLTDQFLLDSKQTSPSIIIDKEKSLNQVIETDESYKRYKIVKNAVTPRGIPGYGTGIVCVDSDEHDENGYITEDFEVRKNQHEKRMQKSNLLEDEVIEPDYFGPQNYSILLISWGSNLSVVNEAIEHLDRSDIGHLHFKQVYPIHKNSTEAFLKKAEKTVVIENNVSSQFAKLLLLETGHKADENLLKYNGMPFSIEEIVEKIIELVEPE